MILKPSSTKMSVKSNDKNDIEIEHDFDGEGRWKYIQPESVVKVPTPEGKYNLYQIYEVEKDMDCVRAYARHIFFNLSKRILIDCRPTNANGQQTLDKILEGTEFTGHSDITTSNTSHYIRKTILNALVSDDENSFFTKFGGELYLDNFDIYINNRIGVDTNIRFEHGKDIASIDDGVNTDETYTRLVPVAFNGRTLPEYYVDSLNIGKYKDYKETTAPFDDFKLKEDFDEGEEPSETDIVFNTKEELYEALRSACMELFEGGLDKPTLNTTLEIVNLENTVEYKDFKNILQVGLGDRVTAYYKPLDIDIHTRVVGYEFDCISKEYISIELGETVRDFMDFNVDASNKINSILNSNNTVDAASIEGIINAFNTKFKAQRDIAQKQHIRAMLFEDLDPDSPTHGAMCIGSMGFEIASKRTPDSKHWDWSTFGSGQGFVADHIVAGILSTILIQNADGSLQIDLSSKKGIMTKKNGKNAIELAGTILKFFDWDGIGEAIGQIFSARIKGTDKPGLILGNNEDAYSGIGYQSSEDSSLYPFYILFDKYNISKQAPYPIMFREVPCLNSYALYLDQVDNKAIYSSVSKDFILRSKEGFVFVDNNNNSLFNIDTHSNKIYTLGGMIYSNIPVGHKFNIIDCASSDNSKMLLGGNTRTAFGTWNDSNTLSSILELTKSLIESWSHWDFNNWTIKNAYVESPKMTVIENNSKTRTMIEKQVVDTLTPNTEYIGEGEIINGVCKIELNLPMQGIGSKYYVQLTPIGRNKKIELVEKTSSYFVVEGTDCVFDYLLKVKQPKKPARFNNQITKNKIEAEKHPIRKSVDEIRVEPYWRLYSRKEVTYEEYTDLNY